MLVLLSCFSAVAANPPSDSDTAKQAVERSQITLPGSRPFHLRAKVVEATNPENDSYNAEIEEYWLAPDKWRRTVKTAEFSQTVIVNGDMVSEQLAGDYYPNWLRTLVNAIFDPGSALQGVDMSKSSDNPRPRSTKFCRRFSFRAGIPPVNNVFSTFCFDGGLLDSVNAPGYAAEYKSYEEFAGKNVAREVREYIEPGTELEASIDELSELNNPDESLFSPQQSTGQLQTLVVTEEALREMSVTAPAMDWPAIRGGKSSGVLSIYLCIDRNGHVRETYALNSDHPEMSDAARKQVMNWQFKPASGGGTPVQVESILTFSYQARTAPNAHAD